MSSPALYPSANIRSDSGRFQLASGKAISSMRAMICGVSFGMTVQRAHVLLHLLGPGRAGDHGADVRIQEAPG